MVQVQVIETDVLIIGGGGAACRAAIEAHDAGADVLVILKGTLGHSGCSRYVGTNAAVGPWGDENDTPELAMRDLLAHGGFLGNQELVKILTEESAARIQELEEWGVDFERNADGSIAITHAAAHTYPRNLTLKPNDPDPQADGYLPGIAMMAALMAQMDSRGIRVMNDVALVDLLNNDGRIVGATAIDCGANKFIALKAKATILATGTYSHVYSRARPPWRRRGTGRPRLSGPGLNLSTWRTPSSSPPGREYHRGRHRSMSSASNSWSGMGSPDLRRKPKRMWYSQSAPKSGKDGPPSGERYSSILLVPRTPIRRKCRSLPNT